MNRLAGIVAGTALAGGEDKWYQDSARLLSYNVPKSGKTGQREETTYLWPAEFEKHPAHRRRQADRRARARRRRASLRTGRGEGLMTAPTMPVRIIERDANWLEAVRDGQLVGAARRKNKRTLWYVTLREHAADIQLSRAATPHVRVSGKLPEDVQQRLLRAVLEAS